MSMNEARSSGISITKVHSMLLVTMQPDLDAIQLRDLSILLGNRVTQERPNAVVLDFSTVELLGQSEVERIYSMLLSLHLLGPHVAITNLCSEIVLYLAETDAIHPEIRFFLSIEDAMRHYTSSGAIKHAR
jgi:anti-anti-sigma regulatory factor